MPEKVSCRAAFAEASKYDQTRGLAAVLEWIDGNESTFTVFLYIALVMQVQALGLAQCFHLF